MLGVLALLFEAIDLQIQMLDLFLEFSLRWG